MEGFITPNIVISKCIEFEACRYNERIIKCPFIEKTKPYINFIPVCPECAIGLGVPREPIDIIIEGNKKRLIQTTSSKDITEKMHRFNYSYLKSLNNIDGFVLKSKSPSCGSGNVKAYADNKKFKLITTTENGFFADEVVHCYPSLAREDENSLTDMYRREHFLIKIFTLAKFRKICSFKNLIDFHKNNCLLFKSYNPDEKKIMDNIISKIESNNPVNVVDEYRNHLYKLFVHPPIPNDNIELVIEIFNQFSNLTSNQEKLLFMENIQRYKEGKITLSPNRKLLKSLIQRTGNTTYADQSFFNPYPEKLMETDYII